MSKKTNALSILAFTLLLSSRSFSQTPQPISTVSLQGTPSPTSKAGTHPESATPVAAPQAVPVLVSPTPTPQVDSSPSELKKLSLEQLMNMDVTSVSKQPQPYGEAPAAIDVITNDEIRRSGASSIPEVLRLADNLEVAQASSSGWNISSRGFNTDLANKLLVLIDGRTVYSPLFSGVFWNAQDYLLEDIDRIEVVSGPGGNLWGANAVNGVINVTSKSAKNTQGAFVEGGGGTELQDFGGVRYGGTLGSDVYYRVYGKYFNRGDETLAGGGNATDAWRMGQGGFRVDDENDPQNRFTLQGDIYDSSVSSPTGGDGESAGGNVLGRWSHTLSENSDLSLQLYYDQTFLNAPKPEVFFLGLPAAPAGIFTDSLDTYDLDFQHHFHLDGNNNFVWGLGYRFTHDVVGSAPSLTFLPNTLDHSLYSGFVQDEIKLGSDLSLTAGSKIEHNDYTGWEFEPSGRLRWDVADQQMIWAAVSRAVRMPSRIDRDIEETSPQLVPYGIADILVGGGDFGSETVVAYELGYRAQLAKEFSTSISTFFNNYNDIRSTSPTPSTILPLFFQNNLEAQSGGVELTADYQPFGGCRFHFGYDLLQENIWVAPGQVDLNKALNETADPKNQVFFRPSIDLPGNLELDPDLRWIDSLTYNANGGVPGIVPSYAELDVRLGWRPLKDVEISVTGQNLLHDDHLEYVAPSPSPTQEIARSVYGKLACRF